MISVTLNQLVAAFEPWRDLNLIAYGGTTAV
jgi:hypothetical protein